MLRDPNLVPLSHQHQHALALCVRLQRGVAPGGSNARHWQDEIVSLFREEIGLHFEAEERLLFPAARTLPGLSTLVNELIVEHGLLREFVRGCEAGRLAPTELLEVARVLSEHVRKEETQLFEAMQTGLAPGQLQDLGSALRAFFAGGQGRP